MAYYRRHCHGRPTNVGIRAHVSLANFESAKGVQMHAVAGNLNPITNSFA